MGNWKAAAGYLFLLFALAGALLLFVLPSRSEAAINSQINFQGKLTNTNGTNVTDGTYSIVFSIYSASSGGSAIWTETQGSVSVTDGIFQVALGSVSSLPGSVDFNSSSLYLGITVGADAEMTPRIRLTASPYSFNADRLDGLDSTGLVQLANGIQTDSSTTNASIAINKTGTTANILDLQRSGASVLTISNGGAGLFKNQTDSTTAFQVQDSSGFNMFRVDTSTTNNLISNPSFEVDVTTGWTLAGGASRSRNTTNTYDDLASLSLTTAAAASDGIRATSFTSTVTAGTYTFSFMARLTSGSMTTLQAGYNQGAGDVNCTLNSTTLSNAGWTQFFCTFTSSGTLSYVYVRQSDATARTFYVDAAQLVSGSNAYGFNAGGVISANGLFTSPLRIQNTQNSTEEFAVFNASGLGLLSVDSLNSVVNIGLPATDTNQVLLQLDSFSTFADTASCTTTANQGGVYYNSSSGALRACVDGTWEDIVTTKGLGLLMFGVVPDSSNAGTPGDIGGISGYTNSPCMVTWSGTQQVTVNPCVAYSGGRKVIVPSTAISTTGLAANAYANVCLTGTNSAPALGTGNATETSAAVPTFSANNPILCLATVRASGTAGNVGFIWDTRTFTTTDKQYTTANSVTSPGYVVRSDGTNANRVITTTTGSAGPLRGVIVATTGTTSTTTINAIIATNGSQYAKVPSGGTAAVGAVAQTNTTAGYIRTSATFTTSYSSLGIVLRSIDTTCTASTNCQYSALVDLSISR